MNPSPRSLAQKAKMKAASNLEQQEVACPTLLGTCLMCVGLAIVGLNSHGDTPSVMAAFSAKGAAIAIFVSVVLDLRRGIKNLIRADLLAIFSLYFLTLFEFLFRQPEFDLQIETRSVREGITACLLGLGGLAIGRHFTASRTRSYVDIFVQPVSQKLIIFIFWSCFIVGYFFMFLAVNFNPVEVFLYFLEPRFTQPWTRGQFGDWKALLNELGLLLYLLPPLGGVVMAKRKIYSKGNVISIGLALAWTFFYGFSSGTRNIFACFLVTFLIGYCFSLSKTRKIEMILVTGVTGALLLVSTVLMLQFRQVGLGNYLKGAMEPEQTEESLFIDDNLYVIARLTELFPYPHPYLGMEIPYLALIRPIPRALWPSKPEGLSISMEDALGVEDLTLASSFVGEAYISGGMVGVLITGLFFGLLTGWWSRLASPRNSDLGILVYASGFFAAVISMRSLFVFTTALLPTLAAVLLGGWFARKKRQKFTPRTLNNPSGPQ